MSARVSPVAAPGSLMKGSAPTRKPKDKRNRVPDYLALIRRCSCLSCDQDPAGEAAHVRMAASDKPVTGTGIKPDDRWALPLCFACHRAQHQIGERPFWKDVGLDPLAIAVELYRNRESIEGMRAVCLKAREKRT